ncbi:hypothetical protein RRF57_012221 [Xylaria bambusicola]|uniref:Uncharacterized protein n=1 Tax=Xylaria bambusicola TaxID=326684 RepID=A0AAN7V3M5_9PEZI
MSEYLDNLDFDALMAPNEAAFDFNFLDLPPLIGQNDATYDFNPAMDLGAGPSLDFDFNAGFHPDPSLPLLPDATAAACQS